MNVSVSDDCIACGACESLCPEAFEVVDEKSTPKKDNCATFEEVNDVAERCPQGAISVYMDQGEPPSIEEVLQEASERGVKGADKYLDSPQSIEPNDATKPDDSNTSEDRTKTSLMNSTLVQVIIVATIVLASGYVTMF